MAYEKSAKAGESKIEIKKAVPPKRAFSANNNSTK
jgi:hypothetical protein